MRNFKDFTRAIAGIATALKSINTVVDDIPVPGGGGGGIDISAEETVIGTYKGQPLYARVFEDSTFNTGTSVQSKTVDSTMNFNDHFIVSTDITCHPGQSMAEYSLPAVGSNQPIKDAWVSLGSDLKINAIGNGAGVYNINITAIVYYIKKSETV